MAGPRTLRLATWASVGLVLLFAALLFTNPGAHATVVLDDLLLTAVPLGAGWLALRRRRDPQGNKLAWTLLGAGSLSWALGNAVWTYYELAAGRTGDFTSLADIAYLACYPLLTAAFLAFPSSLFRRETRARLAIESLLVGTAFFALVGDILLRVVDDPSIRGLDLALTLAYPSLAVVAVSVAWQGMAYSDPSERRLGGALAGAALLLAATETLYGVQSIEARYSTGFLVDAGWLAGFLALGLAALQPDQAPAPRGQDADDLRELAIVLLPMAAFAWAVFSLLDHQVSSLLVWSLVALGGLQMLRQISLAQERRRLVRSLFESRPGA